MKILDTLDVAGLPGFCATTLSLAAEMRHAGQPASAEALRERVFLLLADMESRARDAGYGQESVQQVKYALVALIDEAVLQSHWSFQGQWAGNPLQLELFDDFNAGEEFFTKLNALRGSRDEERLQVMEVYFQCLVLGFRGKHIDLSGMEQLKLLVDAVGRELVEGKKHAPGVLSAQWQRTEHLRDKVRRFPGWFIPVVCAGCLLIVYLILWSSLSLVMSDLLNLELG